MIKFHGTITKEQALKTIDLCLDNSLLYMQEAEKLNDASMTDHIPIFIEFALEEIGKAKIILDKIRAQKSITIEESDGFYDHPTKLEEAVKLFELSPTQRTELQKMMDQVLFGIFEITLKGIKKTLTQGHEMRLGSAFVDLDLNTGEPRLGNYLGENYQNLLIKTTFSVINNMREERKSP
jgi:AbiV family abortive infection protein